MTSDTDDLRDLFVDVTGEEETVTEREEKHSHDPIDDAEVVEAVVAGALDDGLDDAVDGAEGSDGSNAPAD